MKLQITLMLILQLMFTPYVFASSSYRELVQESEDFIRLVKSSEDGLSTSLNEISGEAREILRRNGFQNLENTNALIDKLFTDNVINELEYNQTIGLLDKFDSGELDPMNMSLSHLNLEFNNGVNVAFAGQLTLITIAAVIVVFVATRYHDDQLELESKRLDLESEKLDLDKKMFKLEREKFNFAQERCDQFLEESEDRWHFQETEEYKVKLKFNCGYTEPVRKIILQD